MLTSAVLQNDLKIVEALLPLSITLMGFSLAATNKNLAADISRWTSFLSFWFSFSNWYMISWIMDYLAATSIDGENVGSSVWVKWPYILGVRVTRLFAVLCVAVAAWSMILVNKSNEMMR
ncbi:hypothetical protein FRC03_007245 [Tulasnella sp. 419]|nr:hypothetical protein FRC03_007245 [Tulasnella sp. 419]